MASIIKNQIIKHLSAFARNLKPEQITLEVLRGKGQLRNLELNEDVLSERLELPPWLKIVKAHCSCVSVKIPWHKLRSLPIELFVEEICVTIRLVASSLPTSKKFGSTYGKPYDLAERVIEGISLNVQSIEIYFETDNQSKINFGGSIMLSHFILESRTPYWQQESNINMTRIHDKTLKQVLFFKHITWRVLKIEASAKIKSDDFYGSRQPQKSSLNSPLRFLTENGRCRIIIKKSSLDCSLIAGRIELILEEIHWLAYMAHLRSAIDFYKHIVDLANSTNMPIKVAMQHIPQTLNRNLQNVTNPAVANLLKSPAFRQFDLFQSSHHLIISRIDLHLCDDSTTDDLPPNWNIESGAMQAIIQRLRIDLYPQHSAFDEKSGEYSSRDSWLRYSATNSFTELQKMHLDQHFRMLSSKMDQNMRERFQRIWPQLVSQNVVVRIENLTLQSVSERTTKKDALRSMFTMNKKSKDQLPQSLSFIHLEVTSYNFPATDAYPVPPDLVHMVLAPFEFAPDRKSIRWFVYALENILDTIDNIDSTKKGANDAQQPEIRIELFMPKIILLPNDLPNGSSAQDVDYRLPKRFIIHASTVFLSNFTLLDDPTVPLPVMFKNKLTNSQLKFVKWAERNIEELGLLNELMRRNAHIKKFETIFDRNPHCNEWFMSIPSLWINCDFGEDTWELPLLTDLNIFGCISTSISIDQSRNNILLEPKTNIGVTLDHFQFLQLIELVDRFSLLMDQINADRQFFHSHLPNLPNDSPTTIYCQCDKIHVRLVLPIGPTPSPYDLNWITGVNSDVISPSNTSITCSDLPQYETIDNSASVSNLSAIKNEIFIDSAKGSSSALAETSFSTTLTETTKTSKTNTNDIMEVGLKSVESLTRMNDMPVKRLSSSQLNIRKKIIGTLNQSDFTSDLESNMDDTLSITTSASTEQIYFEGNLTGLDDVFTQLDDEVMEAEEALESADEQNINVLRRKQKQFGRDVNVFDILLDDFNVHARAINGKTMAVGYAKNILIGERMKINCGKIYEEKGATYNVPIALDQLEIQETNNVLDHVRNPMDDANLKLELHSMPGQSRVKLDISGIEISLSDEVVSQLAPFIQNTTEDENPPAIELSLQRCKIEIKDPKKRFPLRIRLGELNIQDGPSSEKQHHL